MDQARNKAQILVRRLIWGGWSSIVLSSLFLYLSGPIPAASADGSELMWAVYLMLARLFGIAAFAIGGVAIFNHRWTEGILLCLIAVALPLLSISMHGTI